MTVTCIILAAGRSSRFGTDKLLHVLRNGDTLIARAVRACSGFPTVVVSSDQVAAALDSTSVTIVRNDEPERGMAHSLRLANARIDAARAIAVLPADLALIEPEHVALVIDALADADVVHPARRDGTPGHPVVFSPLARSSIGELPDGDTIRRLREREGLSRRTIVVEEAWPYADVDTRSDLMELG
jgi:molybdenum cofactor cytidylyltransferase